MRATIIATGSRGDVQPYMALGQGLRRVGHDVRLVTSRDFEKLVTSYGLEVWPVDINIEAALRAQDASAAIERGGLLSSFRKLAEMARTGTRKLVEVAWDAVREADVIIAGLGGMLVAASLAEKLDRPFIQAYNVPLTPTAAYPGALLPWLSFWPRSITNPLSHRLTRQVLWQVARSAGNGPRTELLGLPPAALTGMFDTPVFRRGPILYGFSPAVLPRPAGWEERIHVTGFWFADEPEGWTAPIELREFLDRGPTPVYIGFGSMSSERPEATTQIVLDAVRRSGCRAIVHSGWAGLGAAATDKDVLVVGSVPHSWLFPRMAAIVHHGGAGTTAAAIRAGVPSVVVPFHGDQPFWAGVTEGLGVATRPIPRRKLNAPKLADAITEALGTVSMRRRASELGERVRLEDGVSCAVKTVETAVGAVAGSLGDTEAEAATPR